MMDKKDFKKYLGKKVKAVIDYEAKTTVETKVWFYKDEFITEDGFIILDVLHVLN